MRAHMAWSFLPYKTDTAADWSPVVRGIPKWRTGSKGDLKVMPVPTWGPTRGGCAPRVRPQDLGRLILAPLA